MTEKPLVVDDLKPILDVLSKQDADDLVKLKEELRDTWNKKQIFRTDTEMRISVLNDAYFPTPASKYWQAVREQNMMFEQIIFVSFDLRRNEVKRLRLQKKLEKAIEDQDELEQMEIQIDIDQCIYERANLEQQAHDRMREIKLWSQIKTELDDGSFDTKDVNAHQAVSYLETFKAKSKVISEKQSPDEIINLIGPLRTVENLINQNGELKSFDAVKQLKPTSNENWGRY